MGWGIDWGLLKELQERLLREQEEKLKESEKNTDEDDN